MLPPKCFTCGAKLSHIEIPWIEERDEINNSDLIEDIDKYNEAIKKLTDKLIQQDCCRRLLITYVDLIDD